MNRTSLTGWARTRDDQGRLGWEKIDGSNYISDRELQDRNVSHEQWCCFKDYERISFLKDLAIKRARYVYQYE